mgnify:CR=1 FL=1
MAERERRLTDRLNNLQRLAPQGMAKARCAAMLTPEAEPELRSYVQSIMAAIVPHGYTQAAHMLAHGDLLADLTQLTVPIAVASGNADSITPPVACQRAAAAAHTPWVDLGAVGHACALQAAPMVNRLLGLAPHPQPESPA